MGKKNALQRQAGSVSSEKDQITGEDEEDEVNEEAEQEKKNLLKLC